MHVHCSAINFYALNVLACSIIQGCTTIKLNTKFNAVCTQIVPYCGTNQGCGENMVCT